MRVLAVLVVLLAGCATEVVSTSPRTVVIRARDNAYAESQKLADAECAKYQRFARLIARPGPTSAEFIFDCVN